MEYEHIEAGADGVELRAVGRYDGWKIHGEVFIGDSPVGMFEANSTTCTDAELRRIVEYELRLYTMTCSKCGGRWQGRAKFDDGGRWQCVDCGALNGMA